MAEMLWQCIHEIFIYRIEFIMIIPGRKKLVGVKVNLELDLEKSYSKELYGGAGIKKKLAI